MIQEKISKTEAGPSETFSPAATSASPRKRLIGGREIVLVLIAFTLLAIVPSMAQRLSSGVELKEAPRAALGSAERADENFAGSAFYFMETDYSIATAQEMATGLGMGGEIAAPLSTDPSKVADIRGIGGKANPFLARRGTTDYGRALKCLTDAIYYEAANEPDSGQRGVAQVIINRMRHPTYPNTVCGVIYQGSERRTGCQFSYACDGSTARRPNRFLWSRASRVAAQALGGYVHQPVGMSTHYHATYVYPYWAPSLHFVGTIGAHRFYRWKGSAGRPSAFFRGYAGREPFPAPKPRKWSPGSKRAQTLDPIQLQKKYEREYAAARLKAEIEARAAAKRSASVAPRPAPSAYADITPVRQRAAPTYSTPDYSAAAKNRGGETAYAGSRLPDATNIKPQYQNSGTWKKRPGS
ncbi:MAG: cell wall hydrolase [Sphingorhabdus sp.]